VRVSITPLLVLHFDEMADLAVERYTPPDEICEYSGFEPYGPTGGTPGADCPGALIGPAGTCPLQSASDEFDLDPSNSGNRLNCL
jgi:hypothetical protein